MSHYQVTVSLVLQTKHGHSNLVIYLYFNIDFFAFHHSQPVLPKVTEGTCKSGTSDRLFCSCFNHFTCITCYIQPKPTLYYTYQSCIWIQRIDDWMALTSSWFIPHLPPYVRPESLFLPGGLTLYQLSSEYRRTLWPDSLLLLLAYIRNKREVSDWSTQSYSSWPKSRSPNIRWKLCSGHSFTTSQPRLPGYRTTAMTPPSFHSPEVFRGTEPNERGQYDCHNKHPIAS